MAVKNLMAVQGMRPLADSVIQIFSYPNPSLVPRRGGGGGERVPGTHCCACVQMPRGRIRGVYYYDDQRFT